jgi:hypothetical protein
MELKMKNVLGVTGLALTLIGCETMLPHYRVDDRPVAGLGEMIGYSEVCESYIWVAPGTTNRLKDVAVRLDDATVMNSDLLEQNYVQGFNQAKNSLPMDIRSYCTSITNELEAIISTFNSMIAQGYATQSYGLSQTGAAIRDAGTSIRDNSPTYIPVPSGGATSGNESQAGESTYTLENGRIRTCTATSSGIDVCR